jgi:hypothetical protein
MTGPSPISARDASFAAEVQSNGRHGLEAEQLRRRDPAVARDDLILRIDEHGVRSAEPLDAGRDLLDLFLRMCPRVARVAYGVSAVTLISVIFRSRIGIYLSLLKS